MITAKVIEDSISLSGKRLTTFQVKFHRFILPEFNTHRVFSRNFSSSRAIPTKKLIEQVRLNPAIPVHWGKNQSGMQASVEVDQKVSAEAAWRRSAEIAADQAEKMYALGLHKQVVNRVIEPYMWVDGIVTSTEWQNWFDLRAHDDAQPEIRALAVEMRTALQQSTPRVLGVDKWHLPYVSMEERQSSSLNEPGSHDVLQKISAARCCRVSYLKHDGSTPKVEEDIALFEKLAGSKPIHASPLEHIATPDFGSDPRRCRPHLYGNLNGWVQYRKLWEDPNYAKGK